MNDIVVIPTYNEKDTIGILVAELFSLYPNIRILVVDDNSPDGTSYVVEELKKAHPTLQLLKREHKTGLGDAYKAAFNHISSDSTIRNVIAMDADGSHQPQTIKTILQQLEYFDLIVGSRYVQGNKKSTILWNTYRRMLSTYGNIYAQFLTGIAVKDLTSGFVGIRHKMIKNMKMDTIRSHGYAYQIEFKYHAVRYGGATVHEIPILFYPRRANYSKISRAIIVEGIVAPLKIALDRIKAYLHII